MIAEGVSTQAAVRGWLVLYTLLIAASLALALAAVHFFTIEIDEAFTLLSIGQLSGGPFSERGFIASPVLSSGGPYAAIHYAILRAGLPIEADRLVSIASSCLTLVVVYRIVKSQWGDRGVALFGVTAFLAVPWFVFVSGLAWAETASTLLLIAAAWHWTARGNASLQGSVLSGVLFGLAMATRVSALVALPAIALWSLIYTPTIPVRRGILACAVASAVFLLCVGLYSLLFHASDVSGILRNMSGATGLSHLKPISFMVVDLLVSEGIFPAFIVVAAGGALFLPPQTKASAGLRPFCVLLWLIGTIGWAAWLVFPPFPYLRYLWPALPALWLCGVLLLSDWFVMLGPGRSRLLLQAVVISVWIVQFTLSVRQVALGDTATLEWQGTHQSPIDVLPRIQQRPWQARSEQKKFASFVSNLPDDAELYVTYMSPSFPITLITGKRINSIEVDNNIQPSDKDKFFVLLPSDTNIWTLSQSTNDWFRDNTILYARVGGYSLYKIVTEAAGLPGFQEYPVGAAPHPL
jgi:Dolichyl-phosphate-mannose-protein mannosyltransferase